jgi:UDP-N-acetylglucosamine enolpyruvyl transferase
MTPDRYVVRAGPPLSGTVQVSGMTKNAGLKQMAAALLAPGETIDRKSVV